MRKVSAAEWRWVVVAGVVITLLVSAPYLIGVLNSTGKMRFGGFLFGLEDLYSYIAKMRWGARDGWLLELVYTTEAHKGGFVYLFYMLLGKLAALISGQGANVSANVLIVAYHVARVLCGLLLLIVSYRFVAEFLDGTRQRRLAWCIAILAGDLSWLLFVLSGGSMARMPISLYIPEAFSLLLLYGLPHLALARSLLLGGWLILFRALEAGQWHRAFWTGLTWLGVGIIVPFYVALLGALIGAWLLALWATERRFPWVAFRLASLAGVLPGLLLLYSTWLFTQNPVFATWSAQNDLPSPPPVDYFLAYGLLIVCAIPGAVRTCRDGLSRRTTLLIAWPLLAASMVYLPINVQRRLLEGVLLPLSVLVVLGLGTLCANRPRWRKLAEVGLLACLLPSSFLLIAGGVAVASSSSWPIFHHADELAALDWMRMNAPSDSVVLSTYGSGNLLPAYAGVRVYVGHGPETLQSAAKRVEAEAFFSDGMSDVARQVLLTSVGVDYVWVGPSEQALFCSDDGCFVPASLGLKEVWARGDYAIYEVDP